MISRRSSALSEHQATLSRSIEQKNELCQSITIFTLWRISSSNSSREWNLHFENNFPSTRFGLESSSAGEILHLINKHNRHAETTLEPLKKHKSLRRVVNFLRLLFMCRGDTNRYFWIHRNIEFVDFCLIHFLNM